MDAITLLKQDHKKVGEIFSKIMDTTSRAEKTREDLFNQLYDELSLHSHIEEAVFYPAIKDNMNGVTAEAVQEHHIIKVLLKELKGLSVDTDEWFAKLTVLKENVEHHVKEEESIMFPKAKEALGEDMILVLGRNLQEEKLNFS